MSDLIERQAAIDAARDWYEGLICGSFKGLEKRLRSLPSAQPERLTDDDFETIRIHLNAYKEKLCNQHRWEEANEYQRILDRFMAFASAQPVAKDINVPVKDCISRQEAIDVCNKAIDLWQGQLGEGIVIAVRKKIEELPSTQPETCDTCKHGYFGDTQCDNCCVRYPSHYERRTDE